MTKLVCFILFFGIAPLAELWVHPHLSQDERVRLFANTANNHKSKKKKTRVIVVGGGWAGLSVTDSLSHSHDVHITLLDAGPSVGGLAGGGARSPRLQLPVEPGLHGFWREYRNTIATLERIGVMPDALTEYTPSILVSQNGRVALAPVLQNNNNNNPSFTDLLPPPLDVALLSEFSSQRLTPADRLSALGLVNAWAEFEPENRES